MIKSLLRKLLVASTLAAAALTTSLQSAPITGFDDIQLWYGTGTNRAGLVIDWNDGKSSNSLAWGFRWNGTATGEDMFTAVAGAIATFASGTPAPPPSPDGLGDPSLALYQRQFSSGNSVDRITFDLNGNGALDAGDNDQNSDGFMNGFWSYWNDEGTGDYPTSWTDAPVGFSDRDLVNGSWDAWSYVPDFDGIPPRAAIAAVPEPRSIWLLITAVSTAIVIAVTRHRRAKL